MKDDSLSDTCEPLKVAQKEIMKSAALINPNLYCAKCDSHHDYMAECSIVGKGVAALAKSNASILENVYGIEVWNKAIEDAASVVDQANKDGPYQAIASAREIRQLKK